MLYLELWTVSLELGVSLCKQLYRAGIVHEIGLDKDELGLYLKTFLTSNWFARNLPILFFVKIFTKFPHDY